ncbi:MAG: coagulation factor 5/8 type domain-containing protein, partial [Halothiobacillaceae bacterium]
MEAATVSLDRATPVRNLSIAQGAQALFTFTVPVGARDLRLITSGGSGDADLYVRFGQAATISLYDCRSYEPRTNEKCLINNPTAGTWHVLVDGYTAVAGMTLLADYNTSARTVKRVLAGAAAAYTDSSGQLWATDASVVSGGNALIQPNTTVIDGGRFDPKLFMSERWGTPAYSFPVSNGQYAVNLYFVDTYAPTCATGARIFDVLVEGAVAISNLDIFAEAIGNSGVPGCKRGLVMTVPATVNDGVLNVTFAQKTQSPRISAIEILPIEAVTASSTQNVARGKLTTSSDLESSAFDAKFAVDGLLNTRWSSKQGVDNQWMAVDLGAVYRVGRVVLNWEAAYAKGYRIDVSLDGINWTSPYSTTVGVGGVESIALNGVLGRHVRIFCVTRGTGWGNSLWELSVYSADGTVTPTTYTVG